MWRIVYQWPCRLILGYASVSDYGTEWKTESKNVVLFEKNICQGMLVECIVFGVLNDEYDT